MADKKSSEYMDGWNAHKEGIDHSLNPYHDTIQAFSHRRWVSGWCDRFEAIKHGRSLSLDQEYD